MSLFKSLKTPDRQQTQFAYRVKYWPFAELPQAARELIYYHKALYFRKKQVLAMCNEELTHMHRNNYAYKIVWAYNNPPTEQEWTGKTDDYHIYCEFRTSPAIPEGTVVILSFGLPSGRPAIPEDDMRANDFY